MKYLMMFTAFVAAHLVIGYIAWVGGADIFTRSVESGFRATVSVVLGAYAAFTVFLFYPKDSK